jgi:hypothetical protein
MPSKSDKQKHLMAGVAHGWKPDRIKAPPMKVAQEFERADEAKGYSEGGVIGPPYNMKNKGMPQRAKMVLDPIVLNGTPPQEDVPNLGVYPMAPPPARAAPPPEPTPVAQPVQAAPSASAALADPAFLSYLAKRANDLAAAQADARGRQRWADLANGFARGGDMVAGRKFDEAHAAQNNARAQEPVAELHARNADQSAAVKDVDALQQAQERSTKAARMRAEDDPNSDLSKRARLLAVAQGLIPASYSGPYSASMHSDMLKGATIEQAKAHSAAQIAQAGATLAETKSRHAEQARHDKAMEDIAGAKAAKEKEVPPRQLERYAAIRATQEELEPYLADLEKAGGGPVVGRIAEHNPYRGGDTSAVLGKEHALKIKLARALHGGVPTKIEIDEAGQYIPSIRDTPEQRKSKHEAIKGILDNEVETLKSTYGEGGLKTHRLTTGADSAAAPKAGGTVQVREKASGKVKALPAAQAQQVLADPRFEAVQ